MTVRRSLLVLAAVGVMLTPIQAQRGRAPVQTPRIYVFDAGSIRGLDPKLFNFTRDEIKEVDFVNAAYLIVHPKGTLMFEAGAVQDSHFKADGSPVTEGIMTATRALKPQLAAAGYAPADITYFAMSHYHSDHTANANDFAGATWIVQKAERDFMFSEKPQGIIQPAHYTALKGAKTRILDNEDFDVFGDGTVVVKTTPGHTPGHQVLFVKLARTGPIVLSGDLYHYPEEIATGKTPDFEFDPPMSARSRAALQAFVKQTGAKLWIEHDKPTHAKLPRPPQFLD